MTARLLAELDPQAVELLGDPIIQAMVRAIAPLPHYLDGESPESLEWMTFDARTLIKHGPDDVAGAIEDAGWHRFPIDNRADELCLIIDTAVVEDWWAAPPLRADDLAFLQERLP